GQPGQLWQESGRWQAYGPELLRLKDRHERDFVLQPTSEEAVTDLARSELKSYRTLPQHFYQIQTKFRDERRPRFGILRGREFVMKDGDSFHTDSADPERQYRNRYDTYTRIFTRLGLKFRAVAADPGAIGGTGSHEFHVLAESGEDAIAWCPQSDYAANVELAEAISTDSRKAPAVKLKKVPTPGKTKCEDVAQFLKMDLKQTVKAVAVVHDDVLHLLLLRGDHDLNELKTQKLIGAFRFATDTEIEAALKCKGGGIGFPAPIAPFAACLVPIGYQKSAAVREAADRLHDALEQAGIDVLMDDRDERPGVLFADMDLIGIPHRVVLSERGLAAGNAE